MCISAPNKSTRRSAGRPVAALILIAGLSSCAVGPDFVAPDAPAVARYEGGADPATTVDADGVSQHFALETRLPADWWRLFDCPALDDAVHQGLSASPTIAAAEANLRAARHDLAAGQGIFFPQLDAGASAAREHSSAQATPGIVPEGVFNLFTLSASVDYAFDIFGGERRAVEALAANADYQRNVARAASLTLASNIANTLIAATAYDAEIAATREIIDFERDQVRLATVQAKSGALAYAGVLILQTQLETSEATLPPLLQKPPMNESRVEDRARVLGKAIARKDRKALQSIGARMASLPSPGEWRDAVLQGAARAALAVSAICRRRWRSSSSTCSATRWRRP